MPKLPASSLRILATKARVAFNQHTRSCRDCTPPSALCWLGDALDTEASRAAAIALKAEAAERQSNTRSDDGPGSRY